MNCNYKRCQAPYFNLLLTSYEVNKPIDGMNSNQL